MPKIIKKHFIWISLLIIIGVIGYHQWFINLQPITHGDWLIGYPENAKEAFSLPYIWSSLTNFGYFNIGIFFWPHIFIGSALARAGINIYLVERIIFLFPIAALSGIGIYSLSYYLFKSRLTAFTSAIVYSYNHYAIILSSGHLTLRMAMAIFPFVFLLYLLALEKKQLLWSIIAGLFFFVLGFYEIRIYYVGSGAIILYFFYYLVTKTGIKINAVKFLLQATIITILIPILLNLFALLPIFFSTKAISSTGLISNQLFGEWYIKMTKIMTQFHFGWQDNGPAGWEIQPIIPRFFILPILVFLGIIVSPVKRTTGFFALLLIVGIMLVKLTIPPFPHLYPWLFKNIPGFSLFRESGKFSLYTTLGYSILIGSLISYLMRKNRKMLAIFTAFVVCILYLYNLKPIILNQWGEIFRPKTIPQDYLIVKDYIINQSDYFRTYWVPIASRWSISTVNHPIISYYYGIPEFYKSLTGKYDVNENVLKKLINIASIKYIFIPLEDKENEDNFFEYTGKRQSFIKEVDNLSFIRRIDIGTKEIVVYENKDYRPHLYLTDRKETIYDYIPYRKINFNYINPTEYRLQLTDIKNPVFLNFSEAYHPDWKIRAGEFNWLKALFSKNYFLSDSIHFKNDANLNSFYLDPIQICHPYQLTISNQQLATSPCFRNPDDSYHLNLTLYFRPQSSVYLGGIISSTTLLILLLLFIRELFKSLFNKTPDNINTIINYKNKTN